MTKEEILSDLKFIIDNLENIRQDGEKNAENSPYAYSFGVITALVHQVQREIQIQRKAFPEWEQK